MFSFSSPPSTPRDSSHAAASSSSTNSSPWIRKPLSVVRRQESSHHSSDNLQPQQQNENGTTTDNGTPAAAAATNQLHRHLELHDLIGIGVGGTVGSGIFVLVGQIAAQHAGRACWVSFAVAGAAATLSGACYAELSSRLPAAGSTYVYAYVCLGELAAVAAAACLTLEYGVAGAAVARTWGDKVLAAVASFFNSNNGSADNFDDVNNSQHFWWWFLQPGGIINLPAFCVSAVSTLLLLSGVKESKAVMNWVTLFKMLVVSFMVVGGFVLYNGSDSAIQSQPWAPWGAPGVWRGATTSFFGYLGYDEVCCVAGEAKHPARDMPRAVLGTLGIVTICYILAAVSLTGMIPYDAISATAGFPDAFAQRHWPAAAQLTALGEIASLPVVVVISLMAQPRLTLSMAVDGLLPARVFAAVDGNGNLRGGTLVSGAVMTVIATTVPFTYLDDLISAGILLAFSMTNSCLVLLRCQSPVHEPYLLELLLGAYNALCFVTAMLWSHTQWTTATSHRSVQRMGAVLATVATLGCFLYIVVACPRTAHFGGSILSEGEYSSERHITHHTRTATSTTGDGDGTTATTDGEDDDDDDDDDSFENENESNVNYFSTPAVPFLPCLGMAVNWYLIAQLEITGILLLVLYLGLTSAIYLLKCAPHSVGHNQNWSVHGDYQTVTTTTSTMNASAAAAHPHRQPSAVSRNGFLEGDDNDGDIQMTLGPAGKLRPESRNSLS